MSKQLRLRDFEMIDEDQVPKRVRRSRVDWEALFKKIPLGKALAIPKTQLAPATVREALKRHQAKGQFKNIYTTTRKVNKDKYVTYVVNPSGAEELETET